MEQIIKAISTPYNAAVMHIAGKVATRGFNIVPRWEDTPDTYLDLVRRAEQEGRITVSTEGGDETIYGDAEIYATFRGWHDTTHYQYALDFTIAGEAACTYVQCWDITQTYGRNSRAAEFCSYVLQDIMGQQLYKARHGHFPLDPVAYFKEDLPTWQCLGQRLNTELTSAEDAIRRAENQYGYSIGKPGAHRPHGWQCATDSVGG